MKVSKNWLNDFIDITQEDEALGDRLTSLGLEVEGMEKFQSPRGALRGLVIGKVLTCERHPDADRLSVTTVDVGGDAPLDIVCGAPNIAAGQTVVVATVGTELYDAEGNGFTIKKSKIRGQASEGMICAEDEIGLGKSHDGILVLTENIAIGTLAASYFEVTDDTVYDIGLTPNRSDATAHVGVARDLLASMRVQDQFAGQLCQRGVEKFKVDQADVSFKVTIDDPAQCPRFSMVALTGITVDDAPKWLRDRLEAIGVRSVNNVVDATNYILHELGQPLHAYDADKLADNHIHVRNLPEGSPFQSLDEVERKLQSTDLMICDGAGHPLCMAGVFGGLGSGVTEATTTILLEAAHFDAQTVRRASMHHNLRTESARVFEKGSDPNITVYALQRAALLIKDLTGATIASELFDYYPEPVGRTSITTTFSYIAKLIGAPISPEEITTILEAMDMEISTRKGDEFTVLVPTNKSDVLRPADIVEEVLRVYGFNNIPETGYIKSAIVTGSHPDPYQLRNQTGTFLAGLGFTEIVGLSLTESQYFEKALPIATEELVFINNTSNINKDIMRPTMLVTALETVVHNQNRQQIDLRFFEFGKSYRKRTDDAFEETQQLTLTLTGNQLGESWRNPKAAAVDVFSLKGYVHAVLERLGTGNYQVSALTDDPGFAYGVRYHRGPNEIVRFGQVKKGALKAFGINDAVFFAAFNWSECLAIAQKVNVSVVEPNRFPAVRRDLALVVDQQVTFAEIERLAHKAGKKLLTGINLFDVYENEEHLGAGKKSYAISLQLEDPNKTLKDKEVDKVMDQLIKLSESQLGALVRR